MAKQSCSSTRSRSSGPTPACSYACWAQRVSVDVGQDLARLLPRVRREHRRRHLDRPPLLLRRQRLQDGVADHDGRRGAIAVGRTHGPGVRVGDHDVVHDLLERHALGVGGERIERGVGVVLLADPGEQLEAGAAVAMAVLHADLCEHARHRLRADAAVDRRHRAVPALRRPCRSVVLARSAGEEPGPASFSTPTASPYSASPAFTAMIAVRSAVAPVAQALATL